MTDTIVHSVAKQTKRMPSSFVKDVTRCTIALSIALIKSKPHIGASVTRSNLGGKVTASAPTSWGCITANFASNTDGKSTPMSTKDFDFAGKSHSLNS
jgi:hypothetical protein